MTNAIEILDGKNVKSAGIELCVTCVAGESTEDLRFENSALILFVPHDNLKNLVDELMNIGQQAE